MLSRIKEMLRQPSIRPLPTGPVMVISGQNREAQKAIRYTQQCADFNVPFYAGGQYWAITKVEESDGVVMVSGVPEEVALPTNRPVIPTAWKRRRR